MSKSPNCYVTDILQPVEQCHSLRFNQMAKQSGSTKYTKYSISAIPARLLSQNLAILSPTTANIIRTENKVNGVVQSPKSWHRHRLQNPSRPKCPSILATVRSQLQLPPNPHSLQNLWKIIITTNRCKRYLKRATRKCCLSSVPVMDNRCTFVPKNLPDFQLLQICYVIFDGGAPIHKIGT